MVAWIYNKSAVELILDCNRTKVSRGASYKDTQNYINQANLKCQSALMWVWMSTFQTQNPYNCDSREHALSFLLFNENLRWCATHRKQLPTRSKDNLNDKWVYYREDHLPWLAASSLISTSVTKFVFTGWQMKSKTFIKRKMLRICCISVQLPAIQHLSVS